MKSIEVSAKSREAAIDQALAELGVERHEIEVEILDEGAAGFLGMGRRDVRIRVSADVSDEPPARERAPRNKREGGARGGRPRRDRDDRPRDKEKRDGDKREGRPGKRDDEKREGRPSKRGGRNRGGRNRGGDGDDNRKPRRNGNESKPERAAKAHAGEEKMNQENDSRGNEEAPKPKEDRPPRPPANPAELEARGTEAASLLQELISKMGIESTVSHSLPDDGGIQLNVAAEDSALLIGRKGQTLRSLQYLVNRMMHEGEVDASERLIIDVEGYLDRRREKLEETATRMADRAKEDRRRVRLKPLNAQERRIIHVALADDPDVRTFSVGSSDFRSVIIVPNDELPDERGGRRGGRGGGRGRPRSQDRDQYDDRPKHDDDNYDDDASDDVRDDDHSPDKEETSAPAASAPSKPEPAPEPEPAPQDSADDDRDSDEDDNSGRGRRRRRRGGYRGRSAVSTDSNE